MSTAVELRVMTDFPRDCRVDCGSVRVRDPRVDSRYALVASTATSQDPTVQYMRMETQFRRSGGLKEGNEVASLLRVASSQPVSTLARWIVDEQILTIAWRGQTLLPMFQFDMRSMELRPGLVGTLLELKAFVEAWECAIWFAEPCVWLADASPADILAVDPDAVRDAARRDRFVLKG